MIENVIQTLPNPDSTDDDTGTVAVSYADGSTMIELNVTDTDGHPVRVHLNYRQVSALMIALGSAASNL